MRVTLPFMAVGVVMVAGAIYGRAHSVNDSPSFPLVVFSNQSYSSKIVELGSRGCIQGPFSVYNGKGVELFRLDAGADYPAGCSGRNP